MGDELERIDPSYLRLLRIGELQKRVDALEDLLERCTVCPRDCLNNRLRNEIAACYSGRLPIVSSYTPHFGEEPPLTGTRGAGNIFFGNCNLRCVYCQNYQISQTHKEQIKNEVTHERLAEMMLELQARGCHNINFVSPTHFAPQMARAILIAAEQGLHLPIVYNTNAYDSVEVLRLLDGIVDVYLPDLKYAEDEAGFLYSKVHSYRDISRAAIAEMHRQMGDELILDENGLLKRVNSAVPRYQCQAKSMGKANLTTGVQVTTDCASIPAPRVRALPCGAPRRALASPGRH